MITEQEFAAAFAGVEVGNSNSALYILRDKEEKGATTFDGEPINLETIRDRYDMYCKWWSNKFGKTDPKYLAKPDRKITVYDFLMGGMYNQKFIIEEQPRDLYLFGDSKTFDRKEMVKKTKEFIGHAKQRK